MDYQYCVFIGRFQPFHKAHEQVVQQALQEAKQVIIVIGSCRAARNIKNPWTYEERVDMIRTCFTKEQQARLHFIAARDYYYSDNIWVAQIQQAVNNITKGEQSVALIGSYKDSSSYYIKYFPQWDFIAANTNKTMHATDVRKGLFEDLEYNPSPTDWESMIPKSVANWLTTSMWLEPIHLQMREEYAFIQTYKNQWKNVPFPVTFNTVDAVVVHLGHVLVVRRKFNPGKGLLALPGGFIKQNETLESAAVRELKEETGIKIDRHKLNLIDQKVFDHPGRSLRGRTITHAFYFKPVLDSELPEVRGSDDAAAAFWLPLMDVARLENEFYEDHAHIINHFVNRS